MDEEHAQRRIRYVYKKRRQPSIKTEKEEKQTHKKREKKKREKERKKKELCRI